MCDSKAKPRPVLPDTFERLTLLSKCLTDSIHSCSFSVSHLHGPDLFTNLKWRMNLKLHGLMNSKTLEWLHRMFHPIAPYFLLSWQYNKFSSDIFSSNFVKRNIFVRHKRTDQMNLLLHNDTWMQAWKKARPKRSFFQALICERGKAWNNTNETQASWTGTK